MLFQVSHVLEHKLTDQAQGNLQSLFDAAPEHATLVQLHPDGSPDMAQLQKAKAKGVAVGSNMLVRPGEQVGRWSCNGVHIALSLSCCCSALLHFSQCSQLACNTHTSNDTSAEFSISMDCSLTYLLVPCLCVLHITEYTAAQSKMVQGRGVTLPHMHAILRTKRSACGSLCLR